MITRQELINQIEDYKPFNEQEKMDKLLLLNWIRNNDNAFSRENTVAHMTASAWVVNKDRSKVLMVYHNIYNSWSWLGGHADGETDLLSVALREVKEEAGVRASIVKYIGKSHYNFSVPEDMVTKEVHWYLMTAENYHSRPQREEFFVDSGYYKFHEIYHLLRFSNEKQIVEKAYQEYLELRSQGLWGKQRRD